MNAKICPSCGSEESATKPFVGAFCIDCMQGRLDSKTIFSAAPAIIIIRCQSCGRIQSGRHMYEETPEFWHSLVSMKIKTSKKIAEVVVEVGREYAEADCTFMVDGRRVQKKVQFRLDKRNFMCDSCKKVSSGYHEVIIQLRGPNPKVAKLAAFLQFNIESQGGLITRNEEKGQGIDILIADREAAMNAVMRVHLPYTATRKLKGVKRNGTHHFITTVCFRL